MQRLLSAAHTFLSRMDINWVTGISLSIVGLLGWLDYITGFELSFSFFYLFPIMLTAWYGSQTGAYIVTTASITVWLVSNYLAGQAYTVEAIRYFNAAVRLAVFLLITRLIGELKRVNIRDAALARTDPLTGIFNSREFLRQAEIEIERSARIGYPLSIAYIDLDNFKLVNDRYGHETGDEHLRQITKSISSIIRQTDVFARLGGDEFVLLLPNVDHVNVRYVMEKIQRTLVGELNHLKSPVTFSAGVVTYYALPSTVNEILSLSDALMYKAKSLGKNHVNYHSIEEAQHK